MNLTNKKSVFLNDWDSEDSIFNDFEVTKPEGVKLLFGSYSCANYSGDAFVLYQKDGKLYEVNGSHCSCYGLEGQWEPEETSVEALNYRLKEGEMGKDSYSNNNYLTELIEFLN